MNENNWEEKSRVDEYIEDLIDTFANRMVAFEETTPPDEKYIKRPKYILDMFSNSLCNVKRETLQQQREEMKKEILKIGEHFVKFGEKKGVEAIDMVLAVINPQQTGESKK